MEKLKYKTIPVNGDENYVVKTLDFNNMPEIYKLFESNIQSLHGFSEDDVIMFKEILNLLYSNDKLKDIGLDIDEKINEYNNYDTLVKLNNIYNELSLILNKENINNYTLEEDTSYLFIRLLSCSLPTFLIVLSTSFSGKEVNECFIMAILCIIPGLIARWKILQNKNNRIEQSSELYNIISKTYEDNANVLRQYNIDSTYQKTFGKK